jgi:rare lipoprotein A
VSRRAITHLAAVLCAAGLGLPALAAASSGGGAMAPSPGSGAVSSQSGAVSSQPGNVTVSASGDGMTISTRASAMLRHGLAVSGSLPSNDTGKTVELELWGAKTNWTWQPVASTTVGSGGSFTAIWKTNHIGRFAIRAVLASAGAASAAAALPTVTVVVYRPSLATLYGPGFWGRHTACGVVLHRNTLGVANRTLPCGTPVAIYYRGRTITVPVIDRGPYAHGADWDLTMATGKALRMSTTAMLGATSLPRSR